MRRFRRFLLLAACAAALTVGAYAADTASAAPATSARQESTTPALPMLVSAQSPLPEGYTVPALSRLPGGLQVDASIRADLDAMLADCRKAGLSPRICSAYRPRATQVRLFQNKIARLKAAGYSAADAEKEAARWVAPPDTSEHQTGQALDIVSSKYQVLDHKQADTAEQQWLMTHCWEYGFILRYPEDKTAITGIGYEPWHYRYVGRDAAAAIHESGECLEEYITRLSQPEEPSLPLLWAAAPKRRLQTAALSAARVLPGLAAGFARW